MVCPWEWIHFDRGVSSSTRNVLSYHLYRDQLPPFSVNHPGDASHQLIADYRRRGVESRPIKRKSSWKEVCGRPSRTDETYSPSPADVPVDRAVDRVRRSAFRLRLPCPGAAFCSFEVLAPWHLLIRPYLTFSVPLEEYGNEWSSFESARPLLKAVPEWRAESSSQDGSSVNTRSPFSTATICS